MNEQNSPLEALTKEGMELYKKMNARLKDMKAKDPMTIRKQRAEKMEQEKKTQQEEEEKKNEENRMNMLLTNSKNIVTTKLDNGDILMFSGDHMGQALKTSYRYSMVDDSWTRIMSEDDKRKQRLPRTREEYNREMEKVKKDSMEHQKKVMMDDIYLMMAELKRVVIADLKKTHDCVPKESTLEKSETKKESSKEKKEETTNKLVEIKDRINNFNKLLL